MVPTNQCLTEWKNFSGFFSFFLINFSADEIIAMIPIVIIASILSTSFLYSGTLLCTSDIIIPLYLVFVNEFCHTVTVL